MWTEKPCHLLGEGENWTARRRRELDSSERERIGQLGEGGGMGGRAEGYSKGWGRGSEGRGDHTVSC